MYTEGASKLKEGQVRLEKRAGESGDVLLQQITVVEVSREMMTKHYGESVMTVCLKKGTPVDYIQDYMRVTGAEFKSVQMRRWFTDECAKVEFGLVSFEDEMLEVFWLNQNTNEEVSIGDLIPGEQNTMWRVGYVGHLFVVKGKGESSKFQPKSFMLEGDQILRIGEQETIVGKRKDPYQSEYDRYHQNEIARAARIKKIFTNTGYKRLSVPRELWGSIRTFWNNNRDHKHTFAVSGGCYGFARRRVEGMCHVGTVGRERHLRELVEV